MRLGKQAGPGRWQLGPAGRGPSFERCGQSRKAVWRGSPSRVCLGEASACKGEEAPAPCGHTPLGRSSDPLLQKGKPSPGAGTACGGHTAAGSGVWSHRPPSLVPFPAPSPSVPEPCTRPPWLEHSVLTKQCGCFGLLLRLGVTSPPFHLSGALTSSCGSVRFRGACVVFVFLLSVLSSALSLPGVLTGDVRPVTDVRPSAPADPALLATSLSAPSFARALSVHQAPGLQKRPAAGLGRKSRTRLSGAHRRRRGETLAGCSPLRETRGS